MYYPERDDMKKFLEVTSVLLSHLFWNQLKRLVKNFVGANVLAITNFNYRGKWAEIDPTAKFAYPEHISIGNNSGIGSNVHIYAGAKSIISIGNNTLIGPFAFITSDSFSKSRLEMTESHSGHQADVIIGNNVRIGAHSVILPGVRIYDNASIGAGAVVTKNIPEGKIYGGNPARELKK